MMISLYIILYLLVAAATAFGYLVYVEATRHYSYDDNMECIPFGLFWPLTLSMVIIFACSFAFTKFCKEKAKKLVDVYRKMVYNNTDRKQSRVNNENDNFYLDR